jgi:ferredoxin
MSSEASHIAAILAHITARDLADLPRKNPIVACDLCPSECPIGAIDEESEVPENQHHFIKLNADLAEVWPEISRRSPPLPDHEKWNGAEGKLNFLLQ